MGTVQRIAGLTTVVALLVCPSIGQATGFRIVDQSASATGQASAFTAQADDASAVYYNPAGMTQLRRVQVSLGTLLIGGSTSFTSPTGVNARGDFGGSVAYPPPTNLYITANLKDLGVNFLGDLTAGLAVLSPFGTLQRYPNNGPFATSVTRAALELFDIKPTLAYKVNDQLSLGLGLDIYTFFNFWGEGQAEIKFNSAGAPFNPLVPAGTPLEINGRDTALGFNASLMYTPLRNAEGKPRLNVGLIYRSQAVLDLKGQLLANGTVAADTRFPNGSSKLISTTRGGAHSAIRMSISRSPRPLTLSRSHGTGRVLIPRWWGPSTNGCGLLDSPTGKWPCGAAIGTDPTRFQTAPSHRRFRIRTIMPFQSGWVCCARRRAGSWGSSNAETREAGNSGRWRSDWTWPTRHCSMIRGPSTGVSPRWQLPVPMTEPTRPPITSARSTSV